jgi:hypothetical protein
MASLFASAVLLGLLGLLALAGAAAEPEPTHLTPPPQPPLVFVSRDNFDNLRSAFNSATDRPRVIAMFSPT